ncbi:BZ3500_MvSof-1268-A1-R1_Chr3-1g05479 [Microbotryum saponariae]|uniref:BZ3500_MvSof-1268-A1-R1_Chr3-1g05479 protein n=1 Tax=Microbotryum saponariae TaxID=289078 RepID=A0A2X0LHL6_9BASI|nr:BZ3500_MvSof-1268-A1-R1_Chr3-1g05479 [Microbotryum saponariae]SDA04670.1 BZ3501_MvSof-1269-A2-R1_Chr3-1g05150 [Microbotryum saponariae]
MGATRRSPARRGVDDSDFSITMTHPSVRSVQPRLVKDPTALELLSSHWKTWARSDSKSLPETSTSKSTAQGGASAAEATKGEEAEDGDGRTCAADVEEVSLKAVLPIGDRITWSGWDEIASETSTRRLLIIAYASLGLVIWDCSVLDAWHEMANIRSIVDAPTSGAVQAEVADTKPGAIVSACIIPPAFSPVSNDSPLLAVVTRASDAPPGSSARFGLAPNAFVFIYSLASGTVVHSWSLPGTPHRVSANHRQVVVSTSSPLALHVHSSSDFKALTFSPIRELAPSPVDGSPVFDLGRGGRALAYATDRKVISGSSSAARFDERSVARPGAGILAQRGFFDTDEASSTRRSSASTSYDRAAFFEDARVAGAVGGEVAKRVGGGMLNGAKAIGHFGYNYWTSSTGSSADLGANTAGFGEGDSSAKALSRSSPLPSLLRPGNRSPVAPTSNATFATARQSNDAQSSSTSGAVLIIDLRALSKTKASHRTPDGRTQSPPVLAHFRAHQSPIAALSLTPSSGSILVAPSNGHYFDVFELKPNRRTGGSSNDGDRADKVWHRYRLNRGLTAARTTTVFWSEDARLVAIGTGKGTTHVYALNPTGGRPDLSSHLQPRVVNEQDLAPLSTSLSTIARIRRGLTPEQIKEESSVDALLALAPRSVFVPKATSAASSLRPEPLSPKTASSTSSLTQDLLLFCPASATCVLERLQASPAPATTTEAASRGDVGRLASTAVSGLTQLMKSRGGATSIATSSTISVRSDKKDWQIRSSAKAEWSLARDAQQLVGEGDPLEVNALASGQTKKHYTRSDYFTSSPCILRFFTDSDPLAPFPSCSAQAEIETFSRSPRVLPRSLYASQQFNFFALPRDYATQEASGMVPRPLKRLEMRSEVEVREGRSPLSVDRDEGSSSSPERAAAATAATFDQPIKSAMQTILDDPMVALPSSSPSGVVDAFAHHPGFPNGVAGKQGRHAHSGLAIPIRVGATVRQGLVSTVRGVVAMSVPAGQHLRRRTSGSTSATSGEYCSSSVSFEDDAVFATRDDESASTTCTSEVDEEDDDRKLDREEEDGGDEEGDELDEAAWGWGDDDIRFDSSTTTTTPKDSSRTRRRSDSIAEVPFEEDFDDFVPQVQLVVPTAKAKGRGRQSAAKAKAAGPVTTLSTTTTVASGDDTQ